MPYTKTNWQDNVTPLSAANMNKIEQGIADATNTAESASASISSHLSAGGSAHAEATTTTAGFMSAADKVKLNGIQAGAEVNTVKHYEEGTWTPELRFGGSSTGITYNFFRAARYTRIGNMIFVDAWIELANKGSATGNAQVAGLPFRPKALLPSLGVVSASNVTFPSGRTAIAAHVDELDLLIYLVAYGSGTTRTSLTDTHFANNSSLMLSIAYLI